MWCCFLFHIYQKVRSLELFFTDLNVTKNFVWCIWNSVIRINPTVTVNVAGAWTRVLPSFRSISSLSKKNCVKKSRYLILLVVAWPLERFTNIFSFFFKKNSFTHHCWLSDKCNHLKCYLYCLEPNAGSTNNWSLEIGFLLRFSKTCVTSWM